MSKLTTNPWSRSGRKILRSGSGNALNAIGNPIYFFWAFEDHYEENFGITGRSDRPFFYRTMWQSQAKRLNLPGQNPIYTFPVDEMFTWSRLNSLYLWATVSEGRPPCRVTIWVLGLKIKVIAQYQESSTPPEGKENYIGQMTRENGHRYINGIDRGIWPSDITP